MNAAAVERFLVSGPAGALETILEQPAAAAGHSGTRGTSRGRHAVICHPHPLFGGTMDNKVVTTLARAFHESGISTLRFNFRGVGGSAGSFDAGNGETEDAHAVAAWGASRWPGQRLVIAGFSFGAYVALRLAQRGGASQLITIAPPVARFDFSALAVPRCPWLLVQGDADEVVEPQSVIEWAKGLQPQPQIVVMPGVGHFFHGRLLDLRETVHQALAAVGGG